MFSVRSFVSVGAIVVLCETFCQVGIAREFTDASGKYRIDAQFLGWEEDRVQLKKNDGTVIGVPIDRLSKTDQTYIRSQIGRRLSSRLELTAEWIRRGVDERLPGTATQWTLAKGGPPPKSFRGKMAFLCFGADWDGEFIVFDEVQPREVPEALFQAMSLNRIAANRSEIGTVVFLDEVKEVVGTYKNVFGKEFPAHVLHYRITLVDASRKESIGGTITFQDRKKPDIPESVDRPGPVYVGTHSAMKAVVGFLNALAKQESE